MATSSGFWSYVHADDDAESGRIAQLARDVVAQFELLTGDTIELFLDQDAIEWGNRWRSQIDNSLASVAFFIPVVTPRYFRSAECRRELQFLPRRASDLGISELVMPLLYVDVPGLLDEPPQDDLYALIRDFQWEDWTTLRFADPTSMEYRSAVARLAARLVAANEAAERADVASAAQALDSEIMVDDDDEPGFMDRLADAEDAMPRWADTLKEIGREIEGIGELMQSATADIQASDKRGGAFSARLTVAKRLAQRLREPAERILNFGTEFTNQLHTVDTGIRALIETVPAAVENPDDEFTLDQACEFFAVLQQFAIQAYIGLGSLQGMVDAIRPVEAMSRDLRSPLRTLRQGLTVMIEGQEVIREWTDLVDRSPIDCAEPASPNSADLDRSAAEIGQDAPGLQGLQSRSDHTE